ncbi:hypothetical protein [Croceicoccus gelatinilyticus]|uniref:hypothetical protein n=1 Tax=Croceicoccus gelatinilyticus TaxID=2835536 RepID=UPI001BD0C983|nr:hypothetical protein [Croceicoccus gelatinilyticus]MBS7670925.1 hypothetical protein [Croceicoccus gelatinilyticus]
MADIAMHLPGSAFYRNLKKAVLRMGRKTRKNPATSENGRTPPKIKNLNGKSFLSETAKWKNFIVSGKTLLSHNKKG